MLIGDDGGEADVVRPVRGRRRRVDEEDDAGAGRGDLLGDFRFQLVGCEERDRAAFLLPDRGDFFGQDQACAVITAQAVAISDDENRLVSRG